MNELKLGKTTPRHYPWLEAFRGRVWRSKTALYGRELTLFSAIAILYGVLLDKGILWELGLLGLIFGVLITGISTLVSNLRRLHLVREGQWVEGTLTELVNMRLWHEFLRGKAHRSFIVRYTYEAPNGNLMNGHMVLCRCAYDRLASKKSSVPVVIHPTKISKSLLLRVAIMKIPH
jgi:hypothetical protein